MLDGDNSGVRLPAGRTPDRKRPRKVWRKETQAQKRQRIVRFALKYHARRYHIRYSQYRPTQLRWPRFTTRLDCSGLVATVMHHCKVLPRVDWRWTNTWIQDDFGREVSLRGAKPGDVVFYGPSKSNPTHEALYLGDGQVLSNGHYPMQIYPVDYRSDRVQIRSFL